MNARAMLEQAVAENASDIFLVAGRPLSLRKNGVLSMENEERLLPDDTAAFLKEIYELADNRDMRSLLSHGDDDFSFAIPGVSRFRVSAYKQRGTLSAVIRVITFRLPDYHMLEDPLEFLHRHNKSIVSQREIHVDTDSYVAALRAALRQSPDVILLGEMRDYETINVAMTAAETGHLLFSTLHTIGAANTIDRIIDVFPPNQQHQIAVQLSMVLNAVVSQQLIPTVDGGVAPAFEIMTVTPAIRNMIRDNKIPQIDGILYSSAKPDMISMDNSLLALYKSGKISKEIALTYATNPDMLMRKL